MTGNPRHGPDRRLRRPVAFYRRLADATPGMKKPTATSLKKHTNLQSFVAG